ncbi:unnamed protein product [Protopolystoma xenopodis]|uniref:Uncharacterized protein n=1 Tax=Protopolystoma xenopodis TaxID=117903 RepID=A0A3S5C186_9PLAT|nr:unnamed protein product [Protopolystoma xenopodis]
MSPCLSVLHLFVKIFSKIIPTHACKLTRTLPHSKKYQFRTDLPPTQSTTQHLSDRLNPQSVVQENHSTGSAGTRTNSKIIPSSQPRHHWDSSIRRRPSKSRQEGGNLQQEEV